MAISFGNTTFSTDGLVLYYNPSDPKNYILTEVEILVIGGGGGGSENQYDDGSGGGGGGFVQTIVPVSSSTAYTITVGTGGATGGSGSQGQNSSALGIIAYGGGGGSSHRSSGGAVNGASGGGSGGQYSADTPVVGRAIYGDQGNDGGYSTSYGGGGGGGAGTAGQGTMNYGWGGHGGRGRASSISGTLRYYSAGGGGWGYASEGMGGSGIGGNSGTSPVQNTGAGGGGGKSTDGNKRATSGANGIVIVRYPGPQKATGGNSISFINGHTVHTFTSSGTFTTLGSPTNGSTVYGLYDLSNNLNTANTLGASFAPTYSTSFGGVLSFDGVDDILQIRRSPSLLNLKAGTGGSGFTVLFWARSTNAAGNWRKFIGNDDGDNYIDLYQSPGGLYWTECASTLYVDGVQYAQGGFSTANAGWHFFGATNFNNNGLVPSRDIAIGHEPDQVRAYPFNMNFGQLFIYNRILSLSEINEIFNLTRNRYGI